MFCGAFFYLHSIGLIMFFSMDQKRFLRNSMKISTRTYFPDYLKAVILLSSVPILLRD
jgi:hypothetical protein